MRSEGSQPGFWRSAIGENHGTNSQPGDVWVIQGSITDTDRLNHIFAMAQRGGLGMYVPAGCDRASIDTLILANARVIEAEAMKPPAPPLLRHIKESWWNALKICPKCGSTVERRFIFIGKKRCINEQCGFGKGETEK